MFLVLDLVLLEGNYLLSQKSMCVISWNLWHALPNSRLNN